MSENDEMSVRDRLAKVEAERKELKATLSKEKKERLENAAKNREERGENIKRTSGILLEIQKEIYAYNKSGKVDKGKSNVLGTILNLVNRPQVEGQKEDLESTDESTSSY